MNIIQKLIRKLDLFKANYYLNKSVYLFKKEDHENSFMLIKKAEAIYEKYLPENDKKYLKVYIQFAIMYHKTKEYEKSSFYAKKALIIEEVHQINELPFMSHFYSMIAFNYNELKDYIQALVYLKKAITIYPIESPLLDEDMMENLVSMKEILKKAKPKLSKKEYDDYNKWLDGILFEIASQ